MPCRQRLKASGNLILDGHYDLLLNIISFLISMSMSIDVYDDFGDGDSDRCLYRDIDG